MAVRMGGTLGNIKVPEEVAGETVLVTKLKALGVITGVGADGSDTVEVDADGVKTVAQLVQENATFADMTGVVPDPLVDGEKGLAHVPAPGSKVRFVLAFRAQCIEDPPV
jgi:hypothetical protein